MGVTVQDALAIRAVATHMSPKMTDLKLAV